MVHGLLSNVLLGQITIINTSKKVNENIAQGCKLVANSPILAIENLFGD